PSFRRVRHDLLFMIVLLVCLPFALSLIFVLICLNDASYDHVSDLLDTLILNKMSHPRESSDQAGTVRLSRIFWIRMGFGVGNGSVRASSFPIAAIACLGFLGAASYALFLLSIWFQARGPAPHGIDAMQAAGRSACLAWLIAASVSGGFIDLGLAFSAFA